MWNKQYLVNKNSEIHGNQHLNACCWETLSKTVTEVLELQLNLAHLWENAFYLQIMFPPSPCPFTDFCSIVYLWKVTAFLHGTKEELFSFTMRALCFTWKYQQGQWKIMGFVILFIPGTLISFQRKISFPWGTNPIRSQQHLSFTFPQSTSALSNWDYPPYSLFRPPLLPTWHLTFPVALRVSHEKEQDLGYRFLQFWSVSRNLFALTRHFALSPTLYPGFVWCE